MIVYVALGFVNQCCYQEFLWIGGIDHLPLFIPNH